MPCSRSTFFVRTGNIRRGSVTYRAEGLDIPLLAIRPRLGRKPYIRPGSAPRENTRELGVLAKSKWSASDHQPLFHTLAAVASQSDFCASNNYVRIQAIESCLWGSYAAVQGAASNTLDGCVAASPSCMIWLRKTQRRVTWKAIRGQDMQTCSKLHKWATPFLRHLSLAIPRRVLYGVFCIETLLRWEPRLFAIYGLR